MVLKTYSRIWTSDAEATLAVLRPLVGREPELRLPFRDMEIITLGDFCVVAGPADSLKPFLGTVGPVIVNDLEETKRLAEESGAEIVFPITEGPTGHYMFTRTRDNVVIEYVEWTPQIWERVRAGEVAGLSPTK